MKKLLIQTPHLWLTTELSEIILDRFGHLIQFDEPFPSFKTRDSEKLDGILNSVSQTFGKKFLNPTVLDAAAAYFNQIVRGHPFRNGNKRIAVLFTHVFLLFHNLDFTLNYRRMWYFAMLVATSKYSPDKTKQICKEIISEFTCKRNI